MKTTPARLITRYRPECPRRAPAPLLTAPRALLALLLGCGVAGLVWWLRK